VGARSKDGVGGGDERVGTGAERDVRRGELGDENAAEFEVSGGEASGDLPFVRVCGGGMGGAAGDDET
jgi:hypothetical protein